ncbi:OsmC family protein [Streptomyces sp. NPDC048644]|uniref:OsmC family protein n=1 Tax=Streptomyces sp. NPDC048644 TaxID=3365582 RepID=UPI003720E01F
MIEATALPTAWQVRFRAGENEGLADTLKSGVGGSAGMRPHELLEASLATCMTISARMALADLGIADADADVSVRVYLEREESTTRFRYELALDPALETHRAVVMERIECSPVRATLSRQLVFEAV